MAISKGEASRGEAWGPPQIVQYRAIWGGSKELEAANNELKKKLGG